jgi:hypothetical protein
VNKSADPMALVPLGPVTLTSTEPVPAGETAEIEVAELTVTPVAATPPKLTVFPVAKLVPVIVTVVPPAAGPVLGAMALTVGAVSGVEPEVATTRTPTAEDVLGVGV